MGGSLGAGLRPLVTRDMSHSICTGDYPDITVVQHAMER